MLKNNVFIVQLTFSLKKNVFLQLFSRFNILSYFYRIMRNFQFCTKCKRFIELEIGKYLRNLIVKLV